MSIVRLILIGLLFHLISAVDYCKLCEGGTHTMCKYKEGPGKACIQYKKIELTPGDKKYIVDIHNDIRHHVASGQESRGTLGSQPPAADMLLLQWDEELAVIAQRWADQCIQINSSIQHDVCKKTERFEVGQNILTAVTTDTELPELSILILNWYKQVVNVIPTDIDYFSGIRRGKFLIGQYTQLIWAQTKYVGCGIAAFKEHNSTTLYHHRLVCNYGPAGNIIGQAVYQRGSPCSKCPFSDCNKLRNNLCQGSPDNDIDTKKPPSSKHIATTQTNDSIFGNNTYMFNTKINSSLYFNPDEFHNTTDIEYPKCVTGISTDISGKTKVSSFTEIFSTLPTQTSLSPVWDMTDKSKVNFHVEDMEEEDERIIVYISEASTKINYTITNGTYKPPANSKHRYYPRKTVKARHRSSYNLSSAISSGNELILPDKRRFLKARGIWHNGHCRCNRFYRSHSEKLDSSCFSLLPILLVYLPANIL